MRYLRDFFVDIPGMCVQYFQILTNFLFVWQSFSFLTSLLKLGNTWISPVLDAIFFLKFLVAILGCFYTISK